MDHEQKQIKEFMLAFNQQCPNKPCVPDLETRRLRAKLVLERALETVEALGFRFGLEKGKGEDWEYIAFGSETIIDLEDIYEPELTKIADGLADLNYVTKGTAIACGLDMQLK